MADGLERAKEAAARRAVEALVRPGLSLALGTGTTAAWAVRAIADRFPHGLFDCVASSRATEELARSLGLAVRPLAAGDQFDLMLDGADEVTPEFALTKGGGGALLREKLLAQLSREVAILVDPTKLVHALGERHPIPVEVVPFARPPLERACVDLGYTVRRRTARDGGPYRTDNGNEILDLQPTAPITDPAAVEREIHARVGVVETGVFIGLCHRLYVGHPDGTVEERRPASGTPR